jgi:predicted nucleic acid-binding Zn ribbon protein
MRTELIQKPTIRQQRSQARAKKQPEPFALALDKFVHSVGITKKMKQFSIITSWAEIVGEQIAKVTEAERMNNGILFVKTKSAVWRNELSMRRMEILQKVNTAAGSKLVKEIRFR